MNKYFNYISWEKSTTTDNVIELVNVALKEKGINFKFKKVNHITLDSKKPFRTYQIYKHRGAACE